MPKNQLRPVFAGFRQQPGGNFAFTMVPNQFLDEIVPHEKPCVVKVVGLILRRTLGWIDEKGQRRKQDQVSYSEFAREMNMSLQAVADGLKIAREKGYILRVKPGTLKGSVPEGAWYSLRWEAASELQSEDHSINQNSPTLNSRDMINKAESKKIDSVEIKTSSTRESEQVVSRSYRSGRCPGKANSSSEALQTSGKKYSAYIGNVISEIGEQFGDVRHRLPNIKHALNLWDAEKMSEQDFVKLIYQARDITRAKTSGLTEKDQQASNLQTPPKFKSWVALAVGTSSDAKDRSEQPQPRNRMPYFFRVLEELTAKTYKPAFEQSRTQVDIIDNIELPDEVGKREAILSQGEEIAEVSHIVKPEMVKANIAQTSLVEKALVDDNMPQRSSQNSEHTILRQSWADCWSLDKDVVASRWDCVIDALADPLLKGVVAKVLGIEVGLARPELQAALNLTAREEETISTELDIILICRNAFEARYITRYLASICQVAMQCWGKAIRFHPVYF